MNFLGTINYPQNQNSCRPSDGVSSTPLVVVVVTSLLCYVIAMYYGLKDGFKVADLGDNLAAYGTVVLLLVNFSYIFCTLKILFCVKSNSFPTWQEVRELRNTVMSLTSSFVIGLGLVIVAYSWFTEFGHIRETAIVPIKAGNESLPSIPGDFNVNDTLALNKSSLQNDALAFNERLHRNSEDIIVNINHSLTRDDIKREWFDHFKPIDSLAVPRNKTKDDLRREWAGHFKPIDSVAVPKNMTNTTEDRERLINETGSENTDQEDDLRSYTRDNPPFVSLFFSSFSFCLAGAVIIITTIFEKQCIEALQGEQINNGCVSDYSPYGETERLPLHPVTSRRFVSCNGDGVHEDFLTLGGQDSVIYERTNVARASEEETNVASTSTSSTKIFFHEPPTFSAHESDQSDSAAGKRVHFDEPRSSPVLLYPQYRPGLGHYWCSVCNSILAPIQKSQKNSSVAAPKQQRKKKSAAVNLEEIQGIAQTLSQAQTSRDICKLDANPANKNAELESKPGAENTVVIQKDKQSESSCENLAVELLHSVDNVPEGECIEMK